MVLLFLSLFSGISTGLFMAAVVISAVVVVGLLGLILSRGGLGLLGLGLSVGLQLLGLLLPIASVFIAAAVIFRDGGSFLLNRLLLGDLHFLCHSFLAVTELYGIQEHGPLRLFLFDPLAVSISR